jgi:hypothetical protein
MYHARTALIAAIIFLISACDRAAPPEAPAPDAALGPGRVATVNGEPVPESLFRFYALNQLQQSADDLTPDEREAVLEDLVRLKVLEQAANEAGLPRERTIAAELELQRMRMLANAMAMRHLQRNPVTTAELRAAYEEHLPRFTATQYKARHILVPSEDDAAAIIAELNDVFTSFDRIVAHCRCERIKTIGDAYMAVSGVPEADPDHEFNIARAALRMRRFIERRNGSARNRWRCRIGIASGAMIGSIVGVQKYIYDIFGAPVNLAARLQALAEPMQILATAELAARIRDDFVLRPAGPTEIKGFGVQEVLRLEDEARPQHS